MREDVTVRAQRAAAELERAWRRWRTVHHLEAAGQAPVSSFLGYSMEGTWGQPRVVFGISASEAEQLAEMLVRQEGAASAPAPPRPEPRADAPEVPERSIHVPPQAKPATIQRERAAVAPPTDMSSPLDPPLYRDIRQAGTGHDPAARDLTPTASGPFPGPLAPAGPPAAPQEPAPLAAQAGGVVAFRPRAEPGPDPSAGARLEPAESDGPGQAAPASPGPGWSRPGRLPGGHALPRQKRSGAAKRASSKQEAKDRADRADLTDIAAELAGWAAAELPGQDPQRRDPRSASRPDRDPLP